MTKIHVSSYSTESMTLRQHQVNTHFKIIAVLLGTLKQILKAAPQFMPLHIYTGLILPL